MEDGHSEKVLITVLLVMMAIHTLVIVNLDTVALNVLTVKKDTTKIPMGYVKV